jgi:RNA polymerase sigma-70 factor (TIGR02960 family)
MSDIMCAVAHGAVPEVQAAFAQRVERHRRELHVHCYRMLGNFEEAEDAVQETFLRAWRAREDLEHQQWLRAWLYKIATNACLDAIKRAGRRVPSLGSFRDVPWLQPYPDALLEQLPAPGEEPEAAVVQRETIELAFLAVIQLLPPRQRAVLILREVLDWPAREVAALLEIGIAAVNSALQRARATLRAQLPPGRREDWTARATTDAERELLAGFIDTHERGDADGALALIADDVRVTMPPSPSVYEGAEQLRGLMDRAFGPESLGEWKLVPTRANRMPTAASYLRAHGDDTFRAFKFDVLGIEGGRIAEITTFDATLFAAFGLPETL